LIVNFFQKNRGIIICQARKSLAAFLRTQTGLKDWENRKLFGIKGAWESIATRNRGCYRADFLQSYRVNQWTKVAL